MDGSSPVMGSLALVAGTPLPLEALCSARGWYLGTSSASEGPISRESVEYFANRQAATDALTTGHWTQREGN